MKKPQEPAAYDMWFREEVQASLDDSRTSLSDEQARTHMAARRRALRNKAAARSSVQPSAKPIESRTREALRRGRTT